MRNTFPMVNVYFLSTKGNKKGWRNSLTVQWLGHYTFTAKGLGTKIP